MDILILIGLVGMLLSIAVYRGKTGIYTWAIGWSLCCIIASLAFIMKREYQTGLIVTALWVLVIAAELYLFKKQN